MLKEKYLSPTLIFVFFETDVITESDSGIVGDDAGFDIFD